METKIGKFDRSNTIYKGVRVIGLSDKGDDTAMIRFTKGLSGTCKGIGLMELCDFIKQFPKEQTFTVGGIENGNFFNPKIIIAEIDNAITAKKTGNILDRLYDKPSEASVDGSKSAPTDAQIKEALALVKQSDSEIRNAIHEHGFSSKVGSVPAKSKK